MLITLIVLVVLTVLMAGLSTRLTMAKRRQQNMIEYQRVRYGLDSGLKYILSEFPKMSYVLESREGEPDFSDLFWMDQQEYAQKITPWVKNRNGKEDVANVSDAKATSINEESNNNVMHSEQHEVVAPGPYGFEWPFVTETIEQEIGSCNVTITIEDENAKLPLCWLVSTYEKDDIPANYALETFLEWMVDDSHELVKIEKSLKEDLKAIYKNKHFILNTGVMPPAKFTSTSGKSQTDKEQYEDSKTVKETTEDKAATDTKPGTATKKRSEASKTADFARLFHSSLFDHSRMAVPRPDRKRRNETILKYLGLMGSQRVNINCAPRHVLEATFSLVMSSSDVVKVAQEVITQRQKMPFEKVDEIKAMELLDEETFNKLKNLITTTSMLFKINVTSRSSNTSATAVAAVLKEKKKHQTLMVMYGQ